MLRFFSLFGKSAAMAALDDALRRFGVHPLLVPEAVKLTVIRLVKQEMGEQPPDSASRNAAELLSYCILGHASFLETNGAAATDAMEGRLDAAIDAGDSGDAKLIMLALHAELAAPDIADRIDMEER